MIELRAAGWDDVRLLRTWIRSPEQLRVWAGPGLDWPLTDAELRAYVDEGARGRLIWTAVTVEAGAPVGHASLLIRDGGPVGRLGRILICPTRRGEGLGRALMDACAQAAFAVDGVQTLTLGVYSHNVRALRLYQSLGFSEVARAPAAFEVDGERWTGIEMELPRGRWHAGRRVREVT